METDLCKNCGMPIWGVPKTYEGMVWTHEHNDSRYCQTDVAEPEGNDGKFR